MAGPGVYLSKESYASLQADQFATQANADLADRFLAQTAGDLPPTPASAAPAVPPDLGAGEAAAAVPPAASGVPEPAPGPAPAPAPSPLTPPEAGPAPEPIAPPPAAPAPAPVVAPAPAPAPAPVEPVGAFSSSPPGPRQGAYSPYDDVFNKYAGPLAGNAEFLSIVAAGTKAESGWNPQAVGDQGHSLGIFQMHDQGAGSGMSAEARTDPDSAAAVMVPRYVAAYQTIKAANPTLSGAALASLVAAAAERPLGWDDPTSAARQGYANAYRAVMGEPAPAPAPAAPTPATPATQPVTPAPNASAPTGPPVTPPGVAAPPVKPPSIGPAIGNAFDALGTGVHNALTDAQDLNARIAAGGKAAGAGFTDALTQLEQHPSIDSLVNLQQHPTGRTPSEQRQQQAADLADLASKSAAALQQANTDYQTGVARLDAMTHGDPQLQAAMQPQYAALTRQYQSAAANAQQDHQLAQSKQAEYEAGRTPMEALADQRAQEAQTNAAARQQALLSGNLGGADFTPDMGGNLAKAGAQVGQAQQEQAVEENPALKVGKALVAGSQIVGSTLLGPWQAMLGKIVTSLAGNDHPLLQAVEGAQGDQAAFQAAWQMAFDPQVGLLKDVRVDNPDLVAAIDGNPGLAAYYQALQKADPTLGTMTAGDLMNSPGVKGLIETAPLFALGGAEGALSDAARAATIAGRTGIARGLTLGEGAVRGVGAAMGGPLGLPAMLQSSARELLGGGRAYQLGELIHVGPQGQPVRVTNLDRPDILGVTDPVSGDQFFVWRDKQGNGVVSQGTGGPTLATAGAAAGGGEAPAPRALGRVPELGPGPGREPIDATGAGPLSPTDLGRLPSANVAEDTGELRASTPEGAGAEAPKHEFSSTQANLPDNAAKWVDTYQRSIDPKDLMGDGLETQPHITVKYGLHTNDVADVRPLLADQGPITVTLGKVSTFPPNPGTDGAAVLKADVSSPELHALFDRLKAQLPNTETYSQYQPHVTLAYVRPEAVAKYVGDDHFEGKQVTLNSIAFSDKSGQQTEIPLTGDVSSLSSQPSPTPPARVTPQVPSTITSPLGMAPAVAAPSAPPSATNRPKVGSLWTDRDTGAHWEIVSRDAVGASLRAEGTTGPALRSATYEHMASTFVPKGTPVPARSAPVPAPVQGGEVPAPAPPGPDAATGSRWRRTATGEDFTVYGNTGSGYELRPTTGGPRAPLRYVTKAEFREQYASTERPQAAGASASPAPAAPAPAPAEPEQATAHSVSREEFVANQTARLTDERLRQMRARDPNEQASAERELQRGTRGNMPRVRADAIKALERLRQQRAYLDRGQLPPNEVQHIAATVQQQWANHTAGKELDTSAMILTPVFGGQSERHEYPAGGHYQPYTPGSATAPAPEPAPSTVASTRSHDDETRARLVQLEAKRFKTHGEELSIERLKQDLAVNPERFQPGQGVSWKPTPDQTNRGFRIVRVFPETKEAEIASVADTGLTTSGGNQDRMGSQRVQLIDLRHDAQYDARTTPAAPTQPAAPAQPSPRTVASGPPPSPPADLDPAYHAPFRKGAVEALAGKKDRPQDFYRSPQARAAFSRGHAAALAQPTPGLIAPSVRQSLREPAAATSAAGSDELALGRPDGGAHPGQLEARPQPALPAGAARGDAGGADRGEGGGSEAVRPPTDAAGSPAAGGGVRPGDAGARLRVDDPAASVAVPGVGLGGRDIVLTDAHNSGRGAAGRFDDNIRALKTLAQVSAAGRMATPAEQAILARYSGFGDSAFETAFRPPRHGDEPAWAQRRADLMALLGEAELQSMRVSRLNAFPTTPEVITSIWSALGPLGFSAFNKIRWLEPSAMVGRFLGLQPPDLVARSERTAVEKDTLSGQILRQLYQGANVHIAGIEQAPIPRNYFDLVMSNFPFGAYGVADKDYLKPGQKFLTNPIHNYFFVKSVDLARPGGLVVGITSHFTLDAVSAEPLRKYLADRADLLLAVRLPDDAFPDTQVVTDLIFLRKRAPGDPEGDRSWITSSPVRIKYQRKNPYTGQMEAAEGTADVNAYFQQHKANLLGTHSLAGTMYAGDTYTLKGLSTMPIKAALDKALATLPAGSIRPAASLRAQLDALVGERADAATRAGAWVLGPKGEVLHNEHGFLVPNPTPATDARIRGLIGVRDAAQTTRRDQLAGATAVKIAQDQGELNAAYDAFVKKYGYLNTRENRAALGDDPDAPLLRTLERWDPKTRTATKGDLFSKVVMRGTHPILTAATPKDAMLITLADRGRVDPAHIGALLGLPADTAMAQLAQAGLVYLNPEGGWETEDAYLSGLVRQKLTSALAAAEVQPAFGRNVDALRLAQPTDVSHQQITVMLGAPWIEPRDVNAFIQSLFPSPVYSNQFVDYAPQLATWTEDHEPVIQTREQLKWGTGYFRANKLVLHALNGTSPKAYDPGPNHTRIFNAGATRAAEDKVRLLNEAFQQWLWSDAARTERLVRVYNDRFNVFKTRDFNGQHLSLPGSNPAISLYTHQKSAIWRGLQEGTVLLAHEVGFGKSFTQIATSMEMRRLGIARKPLHVQPKATYLQYAEQFRLLYPAANLLVPEDADLSPAGRNAFMARLAQNDWDAAIVPDSQFTLMPVKPETVMEYIRDELRDLEAAIAERAELRGKGPETLTDKALTAAKVKLEAKLKETQLKIHARQAQTTTLSFEDLGVDHLFVDEVQSYKNLPFTTRMDRVKGLAGNAENQRATDLFLKTRLLQRATGGRGVSFATGTPISNSIAEAWTMLRYLMNDRLAELGLDRFDPWARAFGHIVTEMEYTASGQLKATSRFSQFQNVPELGQLFQQVADVRMAADLRDQEMRKPRIIDAEGKPSGRVVITAEPTPELIAYMQQLQARVNSLHGKPVPGGDNHLVIATDARKASLDMRLVNLAPLDEDLRPIPQQPDAGLVAEALRAARTVAPAVAREQLRKSLADKAQMLTHFAPQTTDWYDLYRQMQALREVQRQLLGEPVPEPPLPERRSVLYRAPGTPRTPGKIELAAKEIARIYHAETPRLGTQLAFLDLGTPKEKGATPSGPPKAPPALSPDPTVAGSSAYWAEGFRGNPEGLRGVIREQIRHHADAADIKAAQLALAHMDYAQVMADRQDAIDQGLDPDEVGDDEDADLLDNVYAELKRQIVAAGVPADQVHFIHEAKNDVAKQALLAKVKSGEIRVLIGSRKKMGTGVNVQNRLAAIHHLDSPWTFATLEQSEGRILRNGNEVYGPTIAEGFDANGDPNPTVADPGRGVEILSYIQKRSYDAVMFKTVERKGRAVKVFMRRNITDRFLEDADEMVISMAMAAAVAVDNPDLMRLAEVQFDLAVLHDLAGAHAQQQGAVTWKLEHLPKQIAGSEQALAEQRATAAQRTADERFHIGGQPFDTNGQEAQDALLVAIAPVTKAPPEHWTEIAQYRGYRVSATISMGTVMAVKAGPLKPGAKAVTFTTLDWVGLSAQGLLQRIRNYVDEGVDVAINRTQSSIERMQQELVDYRAESGAPFARQAEMEDLERIQGRLERKLVRFLDPAEVSVGDGTIHVGLGARSAELPVADWPEANEDQYRVAGDLVAGFEKDGLSFIQATADEDRGAVIDDVQESIDRAVHPRTGRRVVVDEAAITGTSELPARSDEAKPAGLPALPPEASLPTVPDPGAALLTGQQPPDPLMAEAAQSEAETASSTPELPPAPAQPAPEGGSALATTNEAPEPEPAAPAPAAPPAQPPREPPTPPTAVAPQPPEEPERAPEAPATGLSREQVDWWVKTFATDPDTLAATLASVKADLVDLAPTDVRREPMVAAIATMEQALKELRAQAALAEPQPAAPAPAAANAPEPAPPTEASESASAIAVPGMGEETAVPPQPASFEPEGYDATEGLAPAAAPGSPEAPPAAGSPRERGPYRVGAPVEVTFAGDVWTGAKYLGHGDAGGLNLEMPNGALVQDWPASQVRPTNAVVTPGAPVSGATPPRTTAPRGPAGVAAGAGGAQPPQPPTPPPPATAAAAEPPAEPQPNQPGQVPARGETPQPPTTGARQHVVGYGYAQGHTPEGLTVLQAAGVAYRTGPYSMAEVDQAARVMGLDEASATHLRDLTLEQSDTFLSERSQALRNRAHAAIGAVLRFAEVQRIARAKVANGEALTMEERVSLNGEMEHALTASMQLDLKASHKFSSDLGRALRMHRYEVSVALARESYHAQDAGAAAADDAVGVLQALAAGKPLTAKGASVLRVARSVLDETAGALDAASPQNALVDERLQTALPPESVITTNTSLSAQTASQTVRAGGAMLRDVMDLVKLNRDWRAARDAGDWDAVAEVEAERQDLIAQIQAAAEEKVLSGVQRRLSRELLQAYATNDLARVASVEADLRRLHLSALDDAALATHPADAEEAQDVLDRGWAKAYLSRLQGELREELLHPNRALDELAAKINTDLRNAIVRQDLRDQAAASRVVPVSLLEQAAELARINGEQAKLRREQGWSPQVAKLEARRSELLKSLHDELAHREAASALKDAQRKAGLLGIPKSTVSADATLPNLQAETRRLEGAIASALTDDQRARAYRAATLKQDLQTVADQRARGVLGAIRREIREAQVGPEKALAELQNTLQKGFRKGLERAQIKAVTDEIGRIASQDSYRAGNAAQTNARLGELIQQLQAISSSGKARSNEIRRSLFKAGLTRFIGKTAATVNNLDDITTALMTADPAHPEQLGSVMRMLRQPTVWDKLKEYTLVNILASPLTWGLTGVGPISHALIGAGRVLVATPLDALGEAVIGQFRYGGGRQLYFHEVPEALAGAFSTLPASARMYREIMVSGNTSDAMTAATEMGDLNAVRREYLSESRRFGWIGEWLHRLSTRPVDAAYTFLGHTLYGSQVQALAYRQARREVAQQVEQGPNGPLSVEEVKQRILRNLWEYPGIMEEAGRIEDYSLLRTPLPKLLRGLSGFRFSHPDMSWEQQVASFLLQQLFPFMRVPWNSAKIQLEHSVLALPYHAVKFGQAPTREESAKRFRLIVAGAALFAAALALALNDNVTGDGPTEPNARKRWDLSHQPQSIRLVPGSNIWLSYQGTFFGLELAVVANALEVGQEQASKQDAQLDANGVLNTAMAYAGGAARGTVQAVANTPFLRTFQDVGNLMTGRGNATSFWANQVSRLIPADGLLAFLARMGDPYQRENADFTGALGQRIPWARNQVPAKLDDFGRPIENAQAGAAALAPFRPTTTPGTNDPAVQLLDRLQVNVGPAPTSTSIGTGAITYPVPLTAADQRYYETVRGAAFHQALVALAADRGFTAAPLPAQQIEVQRQLRLAEAQAKAMTLGQIPNAEIDRRITATLNGRLAQLTGAGP